MFGGNCALDTYFGHPRENIGLFGAVLSRLWSAREGAFDKVGLSELARGLGQVTEPAFLHARKLQKQNKTIESGKVPSEGKRQTRRKSTDIREVQRRRGLGPTQALREADVSSQLPSRIGQSISSQRHAATESPPSTVASCTNSTLATGKETPRAFSLDMSYPSFHLAIGLPRQHDRLVVVVAVAPRNLSVVRVEFAELHLCSATPLAFVFPWRML
jgi:hypothetical protein